VLLYGAFFLVLGLGFSRGFHEVVEVFPRPVLGVLLAFEAWALLRLARDAAARGTDFAAATLAALCAWGLPYGYVIALVAGTLLHRVLERRGALARGLGAD
jgi:hypothetical protein